MKRFVALLLVIASLFALAIPAFACDLPNCECEDGCPGCHLCEYHYNEWWKTHTRKSTRSKGNITLVNGVDPRVKPCCKAELYEVSGVTTLGLNLRVGPSFKDRIQVRVRNAGLLWVLDWVGPCDEWAYVSYAPGRYGYVNSAFLIPALCYCECE